MRKRNQALDVLRAIAVISVIGAHCTIVCPLPFLDTLGRGVDLFFVLSGFLISGLLFSEFKRTGQLTPWSASGLNIR